MSGQHIEMMAAALIVFHCGMILPSKAQQQAQSEWSWKDSFGKQRSRPELDQVLSQHRAWVGSWGKSGTKADLSGCFLRNANLSGVSLVRANLRKADLSGASLSEANLSGADLDGASLYGTNLAGANLGGANLGRTDLRGADLTRAHFRGIIPDLGLSTAFLTANLEGALFEPKALPDPVQIAQARNLASMTYGDNPIALFQLRKQLQDGGFRGQERSVTYALKTKEANYSLLLCRHSWDVGDCAAYFFNRTFFDLPSQYGMSTDRPLVIAFFVWLVCSVLYFASIRISGPSGLYRIFPRALQEETPQPALRSTQRVRDVAARSPAQRIEQIAPTDAVQAQGLLWFFQSLRREWRMLRAAMFFSLMSAFNIGFQQFDFGRWLRLLTRQEFDMKAVGWARVVAGWQSVTSVYLFALWVLTYFGRPFG